MSEHDGTGSDIAEIFTADDIPPDPGGFDWFDKKSDSEPGDIIDGVIVPEPPVDLGKHARLKSDPEPAPDKDPKSGPPVLNDWMDFFSRVLIKAATDFYIHLAFRDVDENALSDREVKLIRLDKDGRDRIARPFAELSTKAKFTRKHGRIIIASADSIDAVIALGMWFSRVNRIAAKYKVRKTRERRNDQDVSTGSAPQNGSGKYIPGNISGIIPGSG